MTDLRTAAQQALEALEWHLARGAYGADIEGVTGNLRAALAQQAEPVQSRADAMQEMVRGAEVAGLYELTAEPVAQAEPFAPNTGCKTPRECRKKGFCMDGWHCASHALGIKDEK